MDSGINLSLDTHGGNVSNVPVKVEIFDSSFNLVMQSWLLASSSDVLPLEPGVYGVRASVSSGAVFEQAVQVRAYKIENLFVPLHDASPHEDQEWAYLTKPIDQPGKGNLCDSRFAGVWIRLWERDDDGTWHVMPLPGPGIASGPWDEDGVNFAFDMERLGFFALQIGGPMIPWKVVALPVTYPALMALVRPSAAPVGRTHPLEVVVSSDDLQAESLLAFMQRGDMPKARTLIEQTALAEQLLFHKYRDAASAAIGGYYLLRVNELDRLHDWTNNLANWFPSFSDGAIIHAWHLIAEAHRDPSQTEARLQQARTRLLEAVDRGFPMYTEGLRLLRDGLLIFEQRARGNDEEIRRALDQVGEYTAVVDWSAVNTTFTGMAPDKPSATPRFGIPRGEGSYNYVYDVPLREAIRREKLMVGENLVAILNDKIWRCTVSEQGTLVLPDNRSFESLGELHKAVTGKTTGAWQDWRLASTSESFYWAVQDLRRQPEV